MAVTPERIQRVFQALRDAIVGASDAGTALIDARQALEARRHQKLAAGEIVGKNVDEREASARQLLAAEYERVAHAEISERANSLALRLCATSMDELKMELRLAEILAGTPSATPEPATA